MWIAPDLQITDPTLDSVVFDMDGVLLDNAAIVGFDDEAVRFIFSHVYGLSDSGVALLPPAEVKAFKAAGGFNDDFDIVYAAVTLYNAAREQYPDIEDTARLRAIGPDFGTLLHQHQGGLPTLLATVPEAARSDWHMVERVCVEIYWGAAIVREYLPEGPHYIDHPGLVYNDGPLVGAELLDRLANLRLTKWGIITGRVTLELDVALKSLPHSFRQPPVRVTSDLMRKPDPQALLYVIRRLQSNGGFYIGDSADDLTLVQHYEQVRRGGDNPHQPMPRPERKLSFGISLTPIADDLSFSPPLPPFYAVMIAPQERWAYWQQRGAAAIISHVDELPDLLAQMLK